jgi:cAMP-dependent protein kinase regulator
LFCFLNYLSRAFDYNKKGILYCMNRDKFQRLVIGIAFKRRKMYEEFLTSVPLLKQSMNDYERSQVADALVSKTYAPGECIFKQGDQANGMYFIESGQVNIIGEENSAGSEKSVLISELQVGDYFGEIALVNKLPRSASAYAATENECQEPCKLAFLELNAFERLMGPCIELLKSKIGSYKNL